MFDLVKIRRWKHSFRLILSKARGLAGPRMTINSMRTLLIACSALAGCVAAPQVVEVTEVVTETIRITATTIGQSATPDPSEAVPEGLTAEPTKTLVPLQATIQALNDSVEISTPDLATAAADGAVIAPDDYLGLMERGCLIVRNNYVRDNYNGVDWDGVCDRYRKAAETVDNQEAFWTLMEDFIQELDDNHSRFVRPDRMDAEFDLAPPGEGAGIPWPGMIISPAREDEQLMIWYVCRTGAAAAAGLQRGDVVLEINGQAIERGQDGYDRGAISRALFDGSATVSLRVQRGPEREPETIELVNGPASGCDGWLWGLLGENPRIGYLRVPAFDGDADTNIMTIIGWLEEEGPLDGLVVDVRHNPGGNSDRSIAIFTSGVFGQVGPLRADATQTLYRIRGPVRWNETTPMAVLTDGSSHSASEYFATAMQQAGRAVLVGMPTAGNTEGISGFSLSDGSLIRLAVMTLELPDGSTLEEVGVIPDVLVPLGEWGLREVPDLQVQTAYDLLVGQ